MKTALVTGATGFIGASVARELMERGRRVRVLVRPTSDRRNVNGLDVEIREGDLRDADSVAAAVQGCDEVFHVAAEYSFWSDNPDDVYASNVQGTANVMDACERHGVGRVIYTSTVGTIGLGGASASGQMAHDEESPVADGQFTGHYKRSKKAAEEKALEYVARGVPLVVVNPSAPVGPWDRKPTPTGKILVDFVMGKMPAYLDTGLNIVHVKDVAVGHVLAAEKGRVGERYILGNQNMSLAEILAALAKITGMKAPKLKIPYGVAYLAGLASTAISDAITHRPPGIALEAVKMARFHMYFSAEKAKQELGLPQTSTDDAFTDALDWFSKHGYFDSKKDSGAPRWRSP